MRMFRRWSLLAVLAGFAAVPVVAEEIVHFKSGTAMPVRSHEIRGDMIHVDLGSDAMMAFPLSVVESVEKAGKNVILDRSFNTQSNIMSPSRPDPSGSYPMRGVSRDPAQIVREKPPADPNIEIDEKGVAVFRPFSTSPAANRRGIGATGHTRVMQGAQTDDGYLGTTRRGTRHVIGNTTPRRSYTESSAAPVITPLSRRVGPPPGVGEAGDPAGSGEAPGSTDGTSTDGSGGSDN